MNDKEKEYFIYCGVKSKWHDKELDDFENDSEALECVTSYLKKSKLMSSKGIGLYLWGANGTGKSHLMNCSFINLIRNGYKARVYSIDEIVDKFTSSWYSDEEKHDLNNVLRNIDFLGIDEFGKNLDHDGNPIRLPDLVKRVLESVIRFRVQMKRPIWITSNTDPKYVRQVFSEDIASLLNEAVISVSVKGSDFRKIISKRNKRLLK